ncbi:MAG: mannose-1-phosphate guanylyltransferase/mannose-6-phosphate isomerase [Alphaproteobacteria bacterium]|jgi:mannose-1-phosphate guanylyltransferase/mannose-6-phosphate isomerase|nr:mannose-1-phosphate guanylyltransferase/mannose-6-phosphate isomerase [Alphaproteobacteria bacterium]
MIHPIVLSGGTGTRLWPLSRGLFPKQFQPLISERSMLQETLGRLDGLAGLARPTILCNEAHRFIVAEQIRAQGEGGADIILEPEPRNTAPAIAVAAAFVGAADEDAILVVLPADHAIEDAAGFRSALETAVALAGDGHLAIFGVEPRRPETAYGYVETGGAVAGHEGAAAVRAFHEKPDQETAVRYLAAGGYLWNSGMFVFQARTGLEEMQRHCPKVLAATRASLDAAQADLDFIRLDADAFATAPEIAFDRAVMERTSRAVVVRGDFGWSDVGSWAALWEVGAQDENANVLTGRVVAEDVTASYLRSDDRLLAAVGVENLIVVATDDAVLVADRARAEEVKDLVGLLREGDAEEVSAHTTVFRPWGHYQTVQEGPHFKVKRIVVEPGQRLSVQLHHHRAEHWVVVSGQARILIGNDERDLAENESVYVPRETRHRLENPGDAPLILIEVQTGDYLGEDDIVRFEDDYGR